MTEKTLRSEIAYDGDFLKIQKDLVELPNGKTAKREFILHPGASLIVPLFDNFETLLLKQYRHPLGKIFWEFPAGKKDPGENSLKTAQRELFEETGLKANQWTWITDIHPVIGYATEVIHLFLAQGITEYPKPPNHEEFLETKRITFSELTKLVQNHEVTDVKTLVAYFWVEKILRGDWAKSTKTELL